MTFSPRLAALPILLIAACSNAGESSSAPNQEQQIAPDSLKAAAQDGPERAFYQANGWHAAWSDDAARALRQALADRAKHGLDRIRFLPQALGSGAAREAALTRAALRYASALAKGIADPKALHDIYTLPTPDPDLPKGLADALRQDNLQAWLDTLAPRDAAYRALSKAYLQAAEASSGEDRQPISSGEVIHEGETDPRVPRIAAALRRGGYFGEHAGGGGPPNLYTATMAQAVRRMQQSHGIAVDGVVGPDTVEALNRGPGDRARAAAVALERRRWLTRSPPETRIDVNTGNATLTYVRAGKVVDRRKVIVGQPDWETPQLQARFYRFVANPTWTVPKSIERKQMGDVGPAYLRQHNMERRDGYIVQLSGPDNALGLVKFDLDDEYAIYLHDTPSKELFDNNQRHRSHGCIRVEHALGFAEMIAGDENLSSEWQSARARDDETFVRLPDPIPVRLLYHPTSVGASGEVRFAKDVYGWNRAIAQKLGFGDASAAENIRGSDDIGP